MLQKQIIAILTTLLSIGFVQAQIYISEDFNDGIVPPTWTNTAVRGGVAWSVGIDAAIGEDSGPSGQIDNIDGTEMMFFDDDNQGDGAFNRTVIVTSSFDNSTASLTYLEFDYNFRTFSSFVDTLPNDSFSVEVFDGTRWENVLTVTRDMCGNYTGPVCAGVGPRSGFPHAFIDITAYSNANCQVRFIYDDNFGREWYAGVDNVEIFSPFPRDIIVSEIIEPVSFCNLTANESVTLEIQNVGTEAVNNFDVVFQLSSGQTLTETVTATVMPDTSLTYTFAGTVDLSVIQSYQITAYTNLAGDGNTMNDTLLGSVENEVVRTPPFVDDFEGANLWKVQGTNASWELGVPNGFTISSAISGSSAYVTNLSGVYNQNETSFLVSPCFDFSGALADPIVSFNLNYETEPVADFLSFESSIDRGLTWQRVDAGFNASNWYNSAESWQGDSDGWLPVENTLTGLGGQSEVIFRFNFQSDGTAVLQEGIGIDDFFLRETEPIDAAINALLFPTTASPPFCGLGNSDVVVEIANSGINQIDTLFLFYQVDGGTVFLDTIDTPIPPRTIMSHTFSSRFDFSGIRNYNIDIWVSASGDNFNANDSLLNNTIVNTSVPVESLPFLEDFETFIPGTGANNLGSVLAGNWTRIPNSSTEELFQWGARDTPTNTLMTGPDEDHTPSPGDNFMYIEGTNGDNRDVAILESPCIDLTRVGGSTMEFWYHRFDDNGDEMPDLFVDINEGDLWENIAVISDLPQEASTDPYTLERISLSEYVGRRVKVRFRSGEKRGGNANSADMAIDDILFSESELVDVRINSLVTPVTGCDPDGTITVELENFGSTDITTPFPITVSIDRGPIIIDTVNIPILRGERRNYTFSFISNFTDRGTTYTLDITTLLPGDADPTNDNLIASFTNVTREISYQEGFESFVDGACPIRQFTPPNNVDDELQLGWEVEGDGGAEWQVHDVVECDRLTSTSTGPISDNTTGFGKFMYVESLDGPGITRLITPCIDFSNELGGRMGFWYHAFGSTIGTLTVDVFANGVWNPTGFSIQGQQQTAQNDPWLFAEVSLNQFVGEGLIIRFNYNYSGPGGLGASGNFAIDDISFFAPRLRDTRMNAVLGPTSGCDLNENSFITVEVENIGVLDINPTTSVAPSDRDTLIVGFQIDREPFVLDTLTDIIIPSDSTLTYTFTKSADLSIRSRTYNIRTFTALKRDLDNGNDTIDIFQVRNETKITNYFENFENFRDASDIDMLGQVMDNGWTTPNVGNFNWHVQNALNCGRGDGVTPTEGTGPSGDHTTGTGTFLYTEADAFGDDGNPEGLTGEALFQSPCIDLRENTEARMNFWYHRFGANLVDLEVQVDSGDGNWITVSTISGQTHFSAEDQWREETVNLTPYVGKLITIRFRSFKASDVGFAADCAIDDVHIYEPASFDVGITRLISPFGDECELGTREAAILLENFGLEPILPSSVFVEYRVNNGPWTGDTISQFIFNEGNNILHRFSDSINFNEHGRISLEYRATLIGDTILENNSLISTITNQQPGIPYYFMDFEQHEASLNYNDDNLRGWIRNPDMNGGDINSTFMWHVQCAEAPSVNGQVEEGAPPMAPAGPETGPSGDHTFATTARNGGGSYMLLETNIFDLFGDPLISVPDAELTLPCGPIDFSQSAENQPMLSYWYHMFGSETGELEVDISVDGGTSFTQAIDRISGQQQTAATDPWLQRRVSLENHLIGDVANDVVLRFRAVRKINPDPTRTFQGEGRGGDIGIDDVEILDGVQRDASVVSLLDPTPDCNLGASEDFRMRIQNTGTVDILEINLGYQVTFFPLVVDPITNFTTMGEGIVFPPQRDTLLGRTIIPSATFDFSFPNLNMVEEGAYQITAWTEYEGDPYPFNDTLRETIVNITRPTPSCEDFSSLTLGDAFRDFREDRLPNFWVGNSAPYAFEASIENAGPVVGHTGGINDIYMLAVDPQPASPGMLTEMESPCFDLTGIQSAVLEFWYIMPNPDGRLFIRARDVNGASFITLDTVPGGAFTWTQRRVILSDFIGGFVELQFENESTENSFTAIDDICVVVPDPQQIALSEFVEPVQGNCFYPDDQIVSLRLRNIGRDRIDSFDVVLAVDKTLRSNPRGNFFRDTIRINASATPPFFDPGDNFTLNLDTLGWAIDMSEQTNYYFSAFILLPGDNDSLDNRILDYEVSHPVPLPLPYCEDFESGVDLSQLLFMGDEMYTWTNLNDGTFAQGVYPGTEGITGPNRDHTIGDATGSYISTDGSSGEAGEIAVVQSACLDLTTAISPELEYWYYMFVPDGATLILEINDDNGWVNVDQRSGTDPQQGTQNRDWLSQTIDLGDYAGKIIRYRFLVINENTGSASNVALDDICVFDVDNTDIAVSGLAEPNSDSTSCYSSTQEVQVSFRNNGVRDIDLTQDSLIVRVNIFKDNQGDGVFMPIAQNSILIDTFVMNNPLPTPRDSILTVTMSNTFDMSDLGSFYRFDIQVDSLRGELIRSNNESTVVILAQRSAGSITSITPNDVVCFGELVTLRNTGFFGALRWEERRLNENGEGIWFPVLIPPFDLPTLLVAPDSTTRYRTRVCPELLPEVDEVSDSVTIEIIRPFRPIGIDDFQCEFPQGDTSRRLGAVTAPNIDRIYWYGTSNLSDGNILDSTDAGDFLTVTPIAEFGSDSTLYLASVILDDRLNSPGSCTSDLSSGERGVATAGVNIRPQFAFSNPSNPTVRNQPRLGESVGNMLDSSFPDTSIVLCDSTGQGGLLIETVFMDAGQLEENDWTYQWDVTLPNGRVVSDSLTSQTVVVDFIDLEKNREYTYQVNVTTDSACTNTSARYTIFVGDGCVTSINEVAFREDFGIYPNPVKEELMITHRSAQSFKGNIELRSAEGQLIELFENVSFGALEKRIDMSYLARGIYFIHVNSERGTFVEKIIKN